MDFFFMCMRGKQRVCADVGQGAKVEAVQDIIKDLLELPERPRLMKPETITDANSRHNIDQIKWVDMESAKLLSAYGYTRENAVAHEPIPLAFLLPEDEKPFITPLSTPKPIPDDVKEGGDANAEAEAGPSSS